MRPPHQPYLVGASGSLNVVTLLRKELEITYRLVFRDLSASVIPGLLMVLAATRVSGSWGLLECFGNVAGCLAYFGLAIYAFCLCNQVVGIEEDRLNKPDRVIPSGLLETRGALERLALALVAFPLVAMLIGGQGLTRWALAWELVFLFYNLFGLDRHWFTKNVVFIGLGVLVLLAAAWEIVAPLDALAWRWIIVIAVIFGATLNLQDFRDVDGDRAMSRGTLPVTMGQERSRWIVAISIACTPIIVHVFLFAPAQWSVLTQSIEIGLTALNLLVAYRTVRRRGPAADHTTYMLHTYWYCAVIGAGIFVM